ncbi:MAG: hypothetical protein GXO04_01255 [Aquificae bacterium]|nr:hypothetical protein [Aquificota bacterium]
MNAKTLGLSSALEASALGALFALSSPLGALLYLGLHAGSSFLLSQLFGTLAKRAVRRKTKLPFFLLVYFFGPLGFLGGVFVLLALYLKRRDVTFLYESLSSEISPEIEFKGRKAGESFGRIKSPKMVMYMSKVLHPLAIRYLKEAVSSPDDEVRLIAFSRISTLEKDIMNRIGEMTQMLEKAQSKTERFSLLLSIAELYWELVYLGISDEELEHFYANSAKQYAKKALELRKSGRASFLLGRISLREGELDEAERFLLFALRSGFPKERVAPYLLEVYFRKKDFNTLFERAKEFKGLIPPEHRSATILRVWV